MSIDSTYFVQDMCNKITFGWANNAWDDTADKISYKER